MGRGVGEATQLDYTELRLLDAVAMSQPTTVGDVAERLGIDPSRARDCLRRAGDGLHVWAQQSWSASDTPPDVPAFTVGNRLIAALDAPTRRDADTLIERLGGVPSWVKVGLELFCAEGPAIVDAYSKRLSVMLDLKLHDIPETVSRATSRVASLGAGLLTVHAGGGRAMLEAAVAARGSQMRILAVTVLTSLDEADLQAIGARGPLPELVEQRARLAVAAGCDGVVASPHEVARIRSIAPPEFLVVTPGVRPAGADKGDQKRVMTPREARNVGADLVVVGRPLRDAQDPAAAARAIVAELT